MKKSNGFRFAFAIRVFGTTLLLAMAGAAWAGSIPSIDVSDAPYNAVPAAQGIDNDDEEALQDAAGYALAGAYRTIHGPESLPSGSQFEVKWANGQKERFIVQQFACTACTTPVPGTQDNSGCQ